MIPIKITAKLTEPVVYYGDGMHFDGILAWGAFMMLTPEERSMLPNLQISDWADDFDLPLATWECDLGEGFGYDCRLLNANGKLWGWCASAVVAEWEKYGKCEYRRKPNNRMYAELYTGNTINTGSGSAKAYDIALPTRTPRGYELVWYAVGDKKRVIELLSLVPAVGKKVNTGYGTVEEWIVQEISDDISIVDRGVLMRTIPVHLFDQLGLHGHSTMKEAAFRPPYTHSSRIAMCMVPAR